MNSIGTLSNWVLYSILSACAMARGHVRCISSLFLLSLFHTAKVFDNKQNMSYPEITRQYCFISFFLKSPKSKLLSMTKAFFSGTQISWTHASIGYCDSVTLHDVKFIQNEHIFLVCMPHSGWDWFIMHVKLGHSMDNGFIFEKINKN